ncbi:MAG: N-acyl-L-amino acid amidohydrolase [bacterium]|nr:MAG: N-acyl-L-amino acid amidohydrolase [bacterium]
MFEIKKIKTNVAAIAGELVDIRRHLHAHPELSFEEEKTAAYISELLTSWGIEHQTNVAGHGITGLIKGRNPEKKVVALRADIDALPIAEENKVPYKSLNYGVMHACGHDVHITCLLGAVKILNERKSDFEGTIKFIFQPAEEKLPGGAIKMIEAGVLENPRVDAILGQHAYPDLEAGKVGFRSGIYMASSDEINLYIRGKGGHAAIPDKVDDTVLTMAEIIVSLQSIVSRKTPPALPVVLSFGKVTAAGAHNIIPSEVTVQGTLRTFSESWRTKVHELIQEMAETVALAHGCTCDVVIDKGYPFLKNNPEVTTIARKAAEEYLGRENVVGLDIRMTVEDFARYAQQVPACFYRLGVRNEEKGIAAGLHSPHFDVDEKSLETGTGLLVWESLQQLKS